MEWAWILFDRAFREQWSANCLSFPRQPATTPNAQVCPPGMHSGTHSHSVEAEDSPRFCLHLGSCNVLTLKGADCKSWGLEGIARQDSILEHFHQMKYNVVALQETRLRKLHRTFDARYVLVKSAASTSGCYGILLGFSKSHPHGWLPGTTPEHRKPVYFSDSHLSIIAAEPRYLIVRVCTPVIRGIFIAAHAPHTGHTDDEVKEWWQRLGSLIPAKYDDWPRVLLCDANARIGSIPDECVGDFQAEVENSKSEAFRTFVSEQGLWLPSTFEAFQTGDGGTWLHPSGKWNRNDFIGLPVQWRLTSCKAFVEEDIDVSTLKEDHRPVAVTIEGRGRSTSWTPGSRIERFTDAHVAAISSDAFHWIERPDVQTDVHTHAWQLERQLLDTLRPEIITPKRLPRKPSMSADTWKLVCDKRTWRKHLWEARRLQRRTILQACFHSLRYHEQWPEQEEEWVSLQPLIRQHDLLIAQAMFQHRWICNQVVKAMRRDDVIFFHNIAAEIGQFVGPQQAKELWKTVRRSLPKFRQRRMQTPPEQIETLEDQWHHYFQQLETGCPTSPEELLQDCHATQLACGGVLTECDLHELPTLQQVEDMFRQTQKGKSTGMDPAASSLFHAFPVETARLFYDLILKVFLWQAEPMAYKGGIMAVIPKRIGATSANHFRGIMLLPSVAKRVHALLRQRTVQLIERIRPPGQIGGFQHQQVGFASQALRTFCRIAHHRGFSTGVLFVDLSNAFHRLVRELVCGTQSPADIDAVVAAIEEGHGRNSGLRAWLALPGLVERLGASPLLDQLLREVHTNTWHMIAHLPGITKTRQGTRPGSPLADIIFHVLMLDIIVELNEWILGQADFQQLLLEMDLSFDSIVWSDDLAIPWCTNRAEELVPALDMLLSTVNKIFHRRGFDLNMDKGKTGVVLTFQGKNAPQQRRQYLLCNPSGFSCKLSSGAHQWLHATATYRRLGTQFASKLDFAEEMKYRIGQASAAFSAMRKPVLCNRHLPLQTRLRLFQALVGTKFYFGFGAWFTPRQSQLTAMRKALAHFLRCILLAGQGQTDKRPSDCQVLVLTEHLDPRIRLAQDRLLFAHKLFQFGPAFAQHVLQIEYQEMKTSWLSGLFADLKWLHSVLPDSVPECWASNLTDAIEYWQKGAPGWKAIIRRAIKKHSDAGVHDAGGSGLA